MDKYGNTRKVTFTIDDSQYLRNELKRNNLTDKEIDEIFAMGTLSEFMGILSEFKGTFTLYGRGITEDRYELFNVNGEKMDVNDLNPYQKGCIISECDAYFEGRNDKPYGVVDIKEEDI